MAVDTYSALLGLLEQGTGNNNNSWGTNLNTGVMDKLDLAIAGRNSRAVTGGTLDLSGTPPPAGPTAAMEAVLAFTGVLSSTETVTVPALAKMWVIDNRTTGNFGLLFKTPSQTTGVNAPQGKRTLLLCDGTNVVRGDAHEVGAGVNFFGSTAPGGTFECQGGTKLISDFPDLYAVVGTTYGGNGITTFGLPDTYTSGKFLRSRTASVTVGTAQNQDVQPHSHTASASTTGTVSITDPGHAHANSLSDPGHFHNLTAVPNAPGLAAGGGAQFAGGQATSINTDARLTGITINNAAAATGITASLSASTSVTVNNSTGAETRPTNISVMVCIKY